MDRRPKPGEDEEDILKMQEEFLRQKSAKGLKPAAKVVNLRNLPSTSSRTGSIGNQTRKPSKYAQAKGLTTHFEHNEPDPRSSNVDSLISIPTESLETDKVNSIFASSVLGNIIEKNISVDTNVPVPPISLSEKGFPAVTKRDPNYKPGKKSIFAQQMERKKSKLHTAMDVDCETQPKQMKLEGLNLPDKSFILTSANADSIHQENVEMLRKLSEREILEEQEKLMSMLNPSAIKFLKSKRRETKPTEVEVERKNNMEVEEMKPRESSSDTTDNLSQNKDETLWENDVLSHPQVSEWVNFNQLEKDKLEWMKGIQESKKQNGNEPYEARFDFKGYLLPYTLEYTEKTKVLFHHGEESHRPGYSLIELFELSRSSIMQQRVMALNTIAGIIEYYSTGVYKDIIEIPITKIFFVVRFALDENAVAILEPALRAMRNIFFNRIDEASLDSLLGTDYGYSAPDLEHDKSEIVELESKESELKDFHLADIDLVTGLLRTDILQRLQYILNYVKPSFYCVQYSLQILTRLARDSPKTALNIVNCDYLMSCIINNFVPVAGSNFSFDANNVYNGKPVLAAIKLIRVIILQSREAAKILSEKYSVLDSFSAYINSGVDSVYGLKIQIEALSALTNLIIQQVAIDGVIALIPVLLTSLYKHVNGTDLCLTASIPSASHAAVLLQLIRKLLTTDNLISNTDIKSQVYQLLQQGFTKWITQVSSMESSCSHLRLMCAIIDCINTAVDVEGGSASNPMLESIVKKFISTSGFDAIFRRLVPNSNLLSKIKTDNLQLANNLQTLCSTVMEREEKVLPILSPASPIPFLASFVKLMLKTVDPCYMKSFLDHVWPYFNKLKDEVPSLCENWFTRMEIDLLFNLLRVARLTCAEANEMDTVYAVANKTCYILRADQSSKLQYLFEKIIFEEHSFTIDKLLKILSIKDTQFPEGVKCVENIRLCYWSIISASFVKSEPGLICKNWREPILPRDWIYLPIVKLYNDHQVPIQFPNVEGINRKNVLAEKEAEKHTILTSCLRWIILNERCFDNLITDIDITDRFCRVACIFLCDNSLFMNSEIKSLLQECLLTLFSKEKQSPFDFNKDLTGLNNFQDFYTQLLEQFQAVSYGDENFATCILAPIAQKHNVKWRKLLWSEYAGCLRFTACSEEKLCYSLDEYLYPEETDESLLESYFQALTTKLVLPNTLPHKIASHHVNRFRRRQLANDKS